MPTDCFLVDTSAWLLALTRDFVPAIKDRIDLLLKDDAIITIGIIRFEILSGARTEPEFRRFKHGLDALESIETESGVWEEASALYEFIFLRVLFCPDHGDFSGYCLPQDQRI